MNHCILSALKNIFVEVSKNLSWSDPLWLWMRIGYLGSCRRIACKNISFCKYAQPTLKYDPCRVQPSLWDWYVSPKGIDKQLTELRLCKMLIILECSGDNIFGQGCYKVCWLYAKRSRCSPQLQADLRISSRLQIRFSMPAVCLFRKISMLETSC